MRPLTRDGAEVQHDRDRAHHLTAFILAAGGVATFTRLRPHAAALTWHHIESPTWHSAR
jgi:hypothetical protein